MQLYKKHPNLRKINTIQNFPNTCSLCSGLLNYCKQSHIDSSCTSYIYACAFTTRGADAVRSGRAGLLIRRQKSGNDYEKRVHAGQRRACVGYLAQSSRPQTVSAVWERDQQPAEKWSGQGRTSRTGDAASVVSLL